MKIRIYSLFLTVILFPVFVNAQKAICENSDNPRTQSIYESAVGNFKQKKYKESAILLKEVIKLEQGMAKAYYMMGLINISQVDTNLEVAKYYFNKTNELCPDFEDFYLYYYLGDINVADENYDLAVKYLKKFLKKPELIVSDEDFNQATALLKYSQYYQELYKNPVPFDPKPVKSICSTNDEYLPFITMDKEMAFYTRRYLVVDKSQSWSSEPKYEEKFMFSKKLNKHEYDKGEEMPYPFNDRKNEGGATLTMDNKVMYYTVCEVDSNGYFNCDIFMSEYERDGWSGLMRLDTSVSSPTSWDSQPTISADGNTLYFASDRLGGFGKSDIWVSYKNKNGEWSKPQNLGPVINTEGNERSPFIHSDNKTLYFSSDGHWGIGGLDIFYTKWEKNKLTNPKNIGYPINTTSDEFGFFVSIDGKTGYFASNKLKGLGGWDLFSFDLYKAARPEKVALVKGTVKDETDNMPISAKVELKNVNTNQITPVNVDSLTGDYATTIDFQNDYILTVKKNDYSWESKYISSVDSTQEQSFKIDLAIKPIEVGQSYTLNDVYFAYNSKDLTDNSIKVIDTFNDFLKENAKVCVEIQGHTDDVGTADYNYNLSVNRAKTVYDYLITKGVNQSRLTYKGFGATKPIVSNQTEEGKAKNRRTVFVITKK